MNQLATLQGRDMVAWDQPPMVTPDPVNPVVANLKEWAQAADAAKAIAQTLVQSSFVPQAFKGKPVEAFAAILAGAELGLQPMASLKSFDVIQGQAAPRAITLRAVVQAAGHEMRLIESTTTRCRMKGRRRGEDAWQQVDWTIDRAKQLGVTGKDNWRKQPQAMLVARATSELARLIAADAILGIGYSAEEVADGADTALQETITPTPKPARRTLQRRAPEEPTEPVVTVGEGLEDAAGDADEAVRDVIESLDDVEQLRVLWRQATTDETRNRIQARVDALTAAEPSEDGALL